MSEADHNDSLISEWLVEYKQILEAYNISDKTRLNRSSSVKWIASELGSFQIGHIKPYETLCAAIKGKYWPMRNGKLEKHCKIFVYPDPSGIAKKTSATVGVTDIAILRSHGFDVLHHNKAPGMVDSVACVNRMFKTAAGDINCYIEPHLKHLITSMERTKWVDNNADTATIDKKEGVEHSSDGVRYFMEFKFPIRSGQKVTSRGFSF